MVVHQQRLIAITDRSSIGEARRISSHMAELAQIKETGRGRVPLIATELATNLLLHAEGGELLIRVLPAEAGPGIETIALDRGPGIANLHLSMADGVSGGGTRGCGLGAVRRLSTDFEIYSTQPAGTVVVSRVRNVESKSRAQPQFSAICVPAPGEYECGDAWQLRLDSGRLSAVVADGLGHGPLAAIASSHAMQTFGERPFDSPCGYLEAAHSALHASRGAAIAIAQVDLGLYKLSYAGVGNIVGSIVNSSGKSRSLLSHNGIVGVEARKLQQFDYQWRNGDLLIMHSDGLSARWKLDDYPGLAQADTGVVAAILYRDARRGRDDATILVARLQAPAAPGTN